jgi:hypothetical protein
MRLWGVAFAISAALLGCDDKSADVSPITKIPGLAGPNQQLDRSHDIVVPKKIPGAVAATPEPEPPPPPAPPAPVAATPPTAAQLAGSFDLHFNAARGDPLVEDDVRIVGDAKGATLTQIITGKTEKIELWKLDAAAVAKLLKSLDALKWWGLDDTHANGKDQTLSTLEVQRGGYIHQFRALGTPPGPQAEALKLVSKLGATLGAKAKEKLAAPSAETFKASKVTGNPEKMTCEAVPGGITRCGIARCFAQGRLLACFRSPFKGEKGILALKPLKLTVPKGAVAPKGDYYWAFELKDGRKCEGPPAPQEGVRWMCKTGKETEEVERLVHSGEGVLAVVGGGRRMVPITRVWK